ncbi:hypothetical protein IAU60_005258 [Kwoniella sp. DSM 27419]
MGRTIPFSLENLGSHSIFIPAPTSHAQEEGWEVVDQPTVAGNDELVGQKYGRIAVRDKDLIVAVGKEVRMMSLGRASDEGEWKVQDGKVGTYQTLQSPHLSFPVQQVVLNTTGRLLAVVGHHQIVVLVLPKSSHADTEERVLDCRAIPIDEFLFHSDADEAISKVIWHTWGEGGNSLWVLAANGKLREYDITQPYDAVQTFNVLPEKSGSKFTAVDPLSRHATSFAFGIGAVDFSPLMAYVLVANGDLYTIGPVIPLKTDMPAVYLQGLKVYTERRLEVIQRQAVNAFGAGDANVGRAMLQAAWVEALVKQTRTSEGARGQRESSGERTNQSARAGILGRSTTAPGSPSQVPRSATDTLRVHPPHLTESGGPAPGAHRAMLRQGPIVFSPGPQEVGHGDGDEDPAATDLYVSALRSQDDKEEANGLDETVIAIAWSNGRVDIGLEVEKPEPRWISSRDASTTPPTLPIVQSVLLPFPEVDEEVIASNAPSFSSDPIYSDVLYVQHSFGLDTISLRPWLPVLDKDEDSSPLPECEVTRLVESAGSPSKPIVGTAHLCNIDLGYGVVALASSGQLAFVETNLRVAETSTVLPSETGGQSKSAKSEVANPSLLAKPLDFTGLISTLREPSTAYNPLSTLRKGIPEANKPVEKVTTDHLRVLGEIAKQIQPRSQAVRSASRAIEGRLDLEVQELQRQIRMLRECQTKIAMLKKTEASERAKRLLEKQQDLTGRLDGMLRRVDRGPGPEVSQAEKQWFDEVERLGIKVWGGGDVQKGKDLTTRTHDLREELEALKPIVSERQKERDQEIAAASASLRQSHATKHKQLKPLEAALGARSEELRRLQMRMEMLEVKVDAVKGR